jgi:Arc/MetJ-type ribon-helix-helix transcriptional regulator
MNPWKQGGQMTIRINHEDSSVELTRPKESDTWGPVLDMCYDAVRALGFVFESPDVLLDQQERLLGQIHEAVEQYIPDNADVDSVLDGVRKAIDYLVDEGAKAERLLEEERTFGVTQQLGIDAQKKRIDELSDELDRIAELVGCEDPIPNTTGGDVSDAVHRTMQKLLSERVEKRERIMTMQAELDKIRPLVAPITGVDGADRFLVKRGSFLWAFLQATHNGKIVRRLLKDTGNEKMFAELHPRAPKYFVNAEDLGTDGWEIVG